MNHLTINIKGELWNLENNPLVMGILNITPDSFFSGSRKQTQKEIVERAAQIIGEGGRIIDIGAQSTTPTSTLLTAQEEIERLRGAMPVLNSEFPDAIFSIDTFYADVARCAVEEYGVAIVNDISGGQIDANMFQTVANLHVPYILMHMRGMPQTMQQYTGYDDLVQDIFFYFSEKIAQLRQLGVCDVIVDPGFGFSKTLAQNYELFRQLDKFQVFELPLLVGISRKSMIYKLLNITPAQSLNATSVLNAFALEHGANILRVHDVKEAVETVTIMKQLVS
ncbi:dihydropteroate synthase [Dysgonomonas sp. PH5-45]|uniref:dihydropteroate synthase n=1 Tax=unclassified Dysgonomonas TaxID=2630389 RepID=UPI002475DBFC|nr:MULTISPECIES: dihydropteroate synthase [unclassified Dysgonomonas]MDH6354481.1 dihydropteroate synthase [Dysgonomonas sp. PH5-45]MDH6387462.1 dihydropteroate synthase [Dysgonomonas sp. PH5-37]